MSRVRVMIVDDHALFRRGIADVLRQAEMEVVAEAGDGRAAIEALHAALPDVVLMDLHMPAMGGVDAIPHITPLAAVLVLTVSDADRDLQRAIDAGVSGYLLKSADPREVVAAVLAVASGKGALSPDVTGRVLRAARGVHADPLPALSERERAVVACIARGETNRAIADALGISQHTVKTYVRRIFEKLGVHSRIEVALRARAAKLDEDAGAHPLTDHTKRP